MTNTAEITDWHERLSSLFESNIKGQWLPLMNASPYARGDTFERLVGKKRDNASAPDFGDIEIKASDSSGASMISLFTKSPAQNNELRQRFGMTALDAEGVPYKRLSTTFNTKNFTKPKKYDYAFKIVADRAQRKLKVVVSDKAGAVVSDGEVFWDFDELENAVVKKLSRVAVVQYELDDANPGVIRYSQLDLNEGFTFEKFLQAVDAGDLQVDFRLGQYGSGKMKGKLHDHGTAFRMSPAKFREYSNGRSAVEARDGYVAHTPKPKPVAPRPTPNLVASLSKPLNVQNLQGGGYGICWECGRPLTDPKSIARGYGPGCAPGKRR